MAEINDELVQIERFLTCFDRATTHVYGLVKAAFSEVKDRVAQQYSVVKELWNDESSRKEVLKSAENALKSINLAEGTFRLIN